MLLDYMSGSLLIIGYILVGKKIKEGWLLSMFGNIGYLYVGMIKGLYGVAILSFVMGGVAIYNYFKWLKNDPA